MNSTSPFPRREFLRRSRNLGLGAAALTAAPSLFLNRTRAQTGENPSELVRVGIIGTGGQGRSNMNARSMIKHVVAVCDVDKRHAAQAQKEVKDRTGVEAKVFYDYRKLLEDKSIDAVLLGTPDHWHALPAIHACMADKDVYVEKPMTLTIVEGQAMVKAAQYYKRIIQNGSQQRSWPDEKFRRAAEYVRSERIGELRTVRVGLPGVNYLDRAKPPRVPDSEPPAELDYDMWLGPAPWRPYNVNRVHYLFRFFWDYSGGQMTNWGAHHLDIVQWALNMDHSGPVEISGRAEFNREGLYETPQWFEVTYKYANGVTVICGNSHRIGTTFEGQDGIIYVDRGRLESSVKGVLEEPLGADEVHLEVSRDHHQNWLDAIKSRKPPICDVMVGHRSATVCHLGNIAILEGRTIKWDPANERIVGEPVKAKQYHYEYRKPWELPKIG